METIKIEVSVSLSENTQKFLSNLIGGKAIALMASSSVEVEPTPAPVAKPATPVVKPTPQPAAPVAKPTAPITSTSKGIEDVRGLLAQKVNEHRDVIKQKLNELGAPSVTKLDPAKYDEMYNFLESL